MTSLKKMKFLYKKPKLSYLFLLKTHLNIINYSLNIHLIKNYKLLIKKK